MTLRDEPTSPGTPESLKTLREVHADVRLILSKMERIERMLGAEASARKHADRNTERRLDAHALRINTLEAKV